jgi:hypothetical protein
MGSLYAGLVAGCDVRYRVGAEIGISMPSCVRYSVDVEKGRAAVLNKSVARRADGRSGSKKGQGRGKCGSCTATRPIVDGMGSSHCSASQSFSTACRSGQYVVHVIAAVVLSVPLTKGAAPTKGALGRGRTGIKEARRD